MLEFTLASGVDRFLKSEIVVFRPQQNQRMECNYGLVSPDVGHISPIFQNASNILTYVPNVEHSTNSFYGFIYFTKL